MIAKNNLDWLIKELYSYEVFEIAKPVAGSDAVKYVSAYSDINNHGLDALRYLIVLLDKMGYRQDQAFIDYYNNQNNNQRQNEMYDIPYNKADLRQFLPSFDKNTNYNLKPNFKIKF